MGEGKPILRSNSTRLNLTSSSNTHVFYGEDNTDADTIAEYSQDDESSDGEEARL